MGSINPLFLNLLPEDHQVAICAVSLWYSSERIDVNVGWKTRCCFVCGYCDRSTLAPDSSFLRYGCNFDEVFCVRQQTTYSKPCNVDGPGRIVCLLKREINQRFLFRWSLVVITSHALNFEVSNLTYMLVLFFTWDSELHNTCWTGWRTSWWRN